MDVQGDILRKFRERGFSSAVLVAWRELTRSRVTTSAAGLAFANAFSNNGSSQRGNPSPNGNLLVRTGR